MFRMFEIRQSMHIIFDCKIDESILQNPDGLPESSEVIDDGFVGDDVVVDEAHPWGGGACTNAFRECRYIAACAH